MFSHASAALPTCRPARRSGAPVLRLLSAVAAVIVVAGCSSAVSASPAAPPPAAPPTSTPSLTTAGPSAAPAARVAAGPTSKPPATRAVSAVTLKAFAGTWNGHSRTLTVSASGRAHETVGDGCCTPEIDMTFQLSNPRGTDAAHATATATVTAVTLWAASGPKPKVGDKGTVELVDGELTDSLGGASFCDREAQARGVCGA
jgi:hypothetical protein